MVSSKDKREAIDALAVLHSDIESQLLFLEGNSDSTWDTRDRENWEGMHYQLMKAVKLLKLDIL